MSSIVTPLSRAHGGSDMQSHVLALRDNAKAMRNAKLAERDVDRSERAYRGQIYSDVDRADGRFVQNPFCWEVIQRFLPILMAQKPTFAMQPMGDEDELLVKQTSKAGDFLWRQQRMDKTASLAAKRAMKTGTSFLYTGVLHESRGPKTFTRLVSYKNVLPDPGATDDEDWTFCFIHARLTLEQIIDHYGDAGLRLIHDQQLTPSAAPRETIAGMMPGGPQAATYARAGTAATIASGNPYMEQLVSTPQQNRGEDRRYSVHELYLYDQSEIEVDDELDDGEKVSVRVRRYDRPRWITLIEDHYSPDLDRESECAHGQIPVIRLTADDDDGEFWGGGLIAPLIDTVEQISDLQNIMTNAGRLCGSPWWKVSTDSGIKVDTIEGDAGMVLPFNPGSTVEMVAPPQMPQYLYELWNRLLAQANNASGISESARGNIGGLGEDTSGKAIQLAQDPFFTRMKMFQQNLESALSKWGHQTISNAIQYMDDVWWMRLLGPELAGQGLAWKVNSAGEEWDEETLRDMPDIVMTTGSNLPADKTQKFAQALALFNAGAFDPMKPEPARRELLKAADWPDYQKVVMDVSNFLPPMPPGMPGAPPGLPPGPDKGLGGGLSPESEIQVRANPQGQEMPA